MILGEDKMTFDHVKGVQCRMKWNIAGMESNIEQLLDSVRPSSDCILIKGYSMLVTVVYVLNWVILL